MANGYKLWKDCEKCKGDGLVRDEGLYGVDPTETPGSPEGPQITCPLCKGAKRFAWGWCAEEITEMP